MNTSLDVSAEGASCVSEASSSGTETPVVEVVPGEILKKAREARGETLSSVAQILKLSPQQLEALENGRFDVLPGPTFVRGFLRNYARYLNISPEPLLAVINGRVPASANLVLPIFKTGDHDPFAEPPRHRRLLVVLLILLVLGGLGGLGLYMGWFEFKFKMPDVVAKWRHADPSDGDESQVEQPSSSDEAAPASPASAAPVQAPVAQVEPAPAQPVQPAPTAQPTPAQSAPSLPPGVSMLHMSFKHKTLVKVRESTGKLIFTQLVQEGGAHSVKGKPPFTITVTQPKNVSLENNVKLEFDGQVVDWRGRVGKDGAARLILK